MKGYRTLAINILALIFTLVGMQGFEISPEDQGSISTAVLAIVNIVLRFFTDTPVGKKEGSGQTGFKQTGFGKLKMLIILAFLSGSTLLFSGCSTVQKQDFQPFVDCIDVVEIDKKTIGACFVSVKILAYNADAAADAGLISKEQETHFLDKLDSARQLLSASKSLTNTDTEESLKRLRLAQMLLQEVSKQIPQTE